nr:uncharacterized protein K02A2.6-like [Rhipicephalus microplus]
MDLVKPPEPLQLSGNIWKNWLVFKQKLQLFITATGPEKPRPSAVKAAILLSTAGDEALDVYNNFSFAEETEPFERFLRDLKKQAKLCNFGTLEESMIRDQVVFWTNNAKLREKLLSDKDLNLQKAEEIFKAAELAAIQSAAWSNESLHVDVTRRTHRTKFVNGTRCQNCNKVHAPERCPAYGKTCYACKKRNHFAACCNNARRISEVHKAEESDENFDILGISICGVTGDIGADWMVRGKIAGQEIQFKVDTGSQANLLPLTLFNRIAHVSTPRKSAAVLAAYNGSTIKHVGVATEDLEINEAQHSVSFFIVKRGRQAILGLKTCQQFGLVPVTTDAVKVDDEQTKFQLAFPDLFSGTGCVRRAYKMVLREDAVPVVQPARRVPIALKGRLRQELQRIEKASIIVKVDEPTDWVNPLVVVHKKDGTLRICMDPRAVNRSIKREHYPMPSREDIESELAGAQYFSQLNANAGFHQIPLDEATSRICTFATPFGRYRFLRLPFGISSASEVFQKTLTEMFEGLPGVRVYVDDVLIWGDSKEEHDERVIAVLRRAQEEGLTFNPAKCVFCTTQVAFLGDVIERDGIRPDPDVIESIRAMPAPKDKQGVRRLLGVVNYFRKYLPALSDKTALLRSLVKEASVFEWTTATVFLRQATTTLGSRKCGPDETWKLVTPSESGTRDCTTIIRDVHVVVLHVGTNNVREEPLVLIARFRSLISGILDVNPSIRVVVSAFLPRQASLRKCQWALSVGELEALHMDAVEMNAILQALCHKNGYGFVHGTHELMGMLKADGVHVTKRGSQQLLYSEGQIKQADKNY